MSNRIIVYAYVCGDVFHRGHLVHLKNAKALGDYLIVGVLTDEAVMEKKKKPIVSFSERLELVSSLKCVDIAIPQDTYSPVPNVKRMKPNILVESTSHDNKILVESTECMYKLGGKIMIMPYYPDQSSTKIKEKIKEEI